MYEAENNDGWDGLTPGGGEAAQGTYYYLVEVAVQDCGKEQSKEYKGTLTLLR